ncbi:MAG: 50S ribosomal protein L20 [Candidatus Omnitrophica bacterium]|nr:50S ribosomal protein L20 [Candidatus Omnitrophota bacterium]MCB9747109.1 50S ribosomal protein L20 [Candidatus Omnitrophota bacterium]
MVRIKSCVTAHKRKKRVLKQAKGHFGHRSKRYKQAKKSVIKGLQYQYRDRRLMKRDFRSLWIIRINAACQEEGITYSRFISGLSNAEVVVNRKVIAELAVSSPEAFRHLVKVANEANKKNN